MSKGPRGHELDRKDGGVGVPVGVNEEGWLPGERLPADTDPYTARIRIRI